jgi:hypothetical protein
MGYLAIWVFVELMRIWMHARLMIDARVEVGVLMRYVV